MQQQPKKAFTYFPVLEKTKFKIESVVIIDDQVFIGTEGKILLYRFWIEPEDRERKKTDSPTWQYVQDINLGRRKKVSQLECFQESSSQVLSLCDGRIDIINTTKNYTVEEMDPNLQARAFVLDGAFNAFRLCAQLTNKKQLSIYKWSSRDNWYHYKTITLEEAPSAFYMVRNTIAVASKSKKAYQLHFYETEDVKDLFSFTNTPAITALETEGKEDSSKLLFSSVQGLEGTVTNEQGDILQDQVKYPFKSAPQQFLVYEPFLITVEPATIEVHSIITGEYIQVIALKGINGICRTHWVSLAYTNSALYCLLPLPLNEQVRDMIHGGFTRKAIDLYMRKGKKEQDSTAFAKNLKGFQEEAGDITFLQGDWEQAFKFYKNSDVSSSKILSLFPGLSSHKPAEGQETVDVVVTKKVAKGMEGSVFLSNMGQQKHAEQKELAKQQQLSEAKKHLVEFLEMLRRKKYRDDEADKLKEIDIALLKLYADILPGKLSKQIQVTTITKEEENEMKEYLLQLNRWNALALLHKTCKEYRRALEIWQLLGTKKYNDPESNAVQETTDLLSTSDDFSLLTEFSPWVYKENPVKFQEIWINDKRAKNKINHEQALKFLENWPDIQVAYLEYLVLKIKVKEPRFHTVFVDVQVRAVIEASKDFTDAEMLDMEQEVILPEGAEIKAKSQLVIQMIQQRRKLINLLQVSKHYDPVPMKTLLEEVPALRAENILLFSRLDKHYEALSIIVNELKDHQRAEQYCNDRKPEANLEIDPEFEEDDETSTALRHFANGTGVNPVLTSLLQVYLDSKQTAHALDILNKYTNNFALVEVLDLFPPDTRLSSLSNFLINSLRGTLHRLNHAQAVKNLEHSQEMKFRLEKMRIEENHVVINRETMCDKTETLISDRPFALYPNGVKVSLAHKDSTEYNMNIDPISKRDFRERPWTFK